MYKTITDAALKEAQKAFEAGEIPVGAVVFNTKTKQIVATAHNQTLALYDVSAHAEIRALQKVCKKLKTTHLQGYSCYTTLEPCAMCAQALSWAGIDVVMFGAYDPKSGGVEHNARVLNYAHHKPEIIGGVEEKKCQALLTRFFKELRHG